MKDQIQVYAGTAGHSVWFSEDLGEQFMHPNSHSGMYLEARTWCFSSHPQNQDILYAGTDMGIFVWQENLRRWCPLPSPATDVWAIAQAPHHPEILLVGARPAQLFYSENAGLDWQEIHIPGLKSFSEINMGPTRFTQILYDPIDRNTIWATVEIGGIFKSIDSGLNWHEVSTGLESIDVHGICITQDSANHKIIYATTNVGLHRSLNNGQSWEYVLLDSPWQYTRAIICQPDNRSILWLCNGNGPPGNTGKLLKSMDCGFTWQEVPIEEHLNSTPWCIAVDPSNPNIIFFCTNLGQLFRSLDQGITWKKMPHEFGELRTLHWRTTLYNECRQPHSITIRKIPETLKKNDAEAS
jgi:hypothetical protein